MYTENNFIIPKPNIPLNITEIEEEAIIREIENEIEGDEVVPEENFGKYFYRLT